MSAVSTDDDHNSEFLVTDGSHPSILHIMTATLEDSLWSPYLNIDINMCCRWLLIEGTEIPRTTSWARSGMDGNDDNTVDYNMTTSWWLQRKTCITIWAILKLRALLAVPPQIELDIYLEFRPWTACFHRLTLLLQRYHFISALIFCWWWLLGWLINLNQFCYWMYSDENLSLPKLLWPINQTPTFIRATLPQHDTNM